MTYIVAIATQHLGILAADTLRHSYQWREGDSTPLISQGEVGLKIDSLYPAWFGFSGNRDFRRAFTEELEAKGLDEAGLKAAMGAVRQHAPRILDGFAPGAKDHRVTLATRGYLIRPNYLAGLDTPGFRCDVLDPFSGSITNHAAVSAQPSQLSAELARELLIKHLGGIRSARTWQEAAKQLEPLFADVSKHVGQAINRAIQFAFVWQDETKIIHHQFIAEIEG